MNTVEVKYGDNVAGVASQLLAAASQLDLHASVVKTTSDGVFHVPEEVAEQAGLSYDVLDGDGDSTVAPDADAADDVQVDENAIEVPEGDLDGRVAWVAEGEDESERTKRANAVWTHEVDSGADQADLDALGDQLTVAVHGSAPDADDDEDAKTEEKVEEPEADELPVGKALDEALTNAGLSKSGNKAAKQARLAEHLSKKE